ncbi:TetR/AcrR family transcriptional regulator [Nocardia paucivorans]|uniref:TetR/AcrR family transcriptional regulator n=1 Tax=Nocardia paucivorans TaxID=114259 RepID=UPI00030BBEE1|nr:TetR/AcrR family transcriptional regulator [Nocardia paucivorans]
MTVRGTREALIAAGVELLEETGSTDIGLREIARRAGVSHGAPRRWFPTHKQLLAAIAEVGLQDLARVLAEARGVDGAPDITEMARAYLAFARARPAMFTLIFRHDLLDGSGVGLRSISLPLFEQVVAQVGATRPDQDARIAATALWVGIHGIAVLATTGALALAAPEVEVDELLRRVVCDALG